MRTARVIVVPYDEAWKSDFEKIKKEIDMAVGDLIVGIEHVGSTAVEGLSAKPCSRSLTCNNGSSAISGSKARRSGSQRPRSRCLRG